MMVFGWFFEVPEIWIQFQRTKLPNSNSVNNFASLDTPGIPESVKVVELFVFEKNFSCFFDVGATWQKKAQNGIEFFLKRGKLSQKYFRLTFAIHFNILNIRELKDVVEKSKNQFLKLGNVAKKKSSNQFGLAKRQLWT